MDNTNCPICIDNQEQIIITQETITKYVEKIHYYETQINNQIFAGVNRLALRPYYQSLDTVRKLHQLYTRLLTSLEAIYDQHLDFHYHS